MQVELMVVTACLKFEKEMICTCSDPINHLLAPESISNSSTTPVDINYSASPNVMLIPDHGPLSGAISYAKNVDQILLGVVDTEAYLCSFIFSSPSCQCL